MQAEVTGPIPGTLLIIFKIFCESLCREMCLLMSEFIFLS